MNNLLLESIFVQYKHGEYIVKNIENTDTDFIHAVNPNKYSPVAFELEPVIQSLSNEDLPSPILPYSREDIINFSLRLTKKYGFLNFPKYLQFSQDDIELNQHVKLFDSSDDKYQDDIINRHNGESTHDWYQFVRSLQYALRRNVDDSYYQSLDVHEKYFKNISVDYYLSQIHPVFDFDSQSISLKCNSLAAAIMLSVVSNKKHLKSCEVCSKLFFAERITAKFCNQNCRQKNSRK